MQSLKKFYVFSVGFDDIYYNYSNSRRFKICLFNCMFMWIVTLMQLFITASGNLWSKFENPFLPDQFRFVHLLGVLLFFLVCGMKSDILLGEINSNLSQYKIFYFLMHNFKHKHRLLGANYKKLAVLSRILQNFILDYTGPTIAILAAITISGIAFLSNQWIWYVQTLFLVPVHVLVASTIAPMFCVIYLIFTYYKMLFDQINNKIESELTGKIRVIYKRREHRLTRLIHGHNLISIEIHKLNLLLRRTAALIFIMFSFIKIVSLYIMINTNNHLMKILVTNVFVSFFIFGFGLTYLFSLQIKSAHKCHKIIHSVICTHTMRPSFKLKVIQ